MIKHTGRYHDLIKHNDAAWSLLDPAGVMRFEATDRDPAETLELRHCACRSTLARKVEP